MRMTEFRLLWGGKSRPYQAMRAGAAGRGLSGLVFGCREDSN
jgi:hypothetical protein